MGCEPQGGFGQQGEKPGRAGHMKLFRPELMMKVQWRLLISSGRGAMSSHKYKKEREERIALDPFRRRITNHSAREDKEWANLHLCGFDHNTSHSAYTYR